MILGKSWKKEERRKGARLGMEGEKGGERTRGRKEKKERKATH